MDSGACIHPVQIHRDGSIRWQAGLRVTISPILDEGYIRVCQGSDRIHERSLSQLISWNYSTTPLEIQGVISWVETICKKTKKPLFRAVSNIG